MNIIELVKEYVLERINEYKINSNDNYDFWSEHIKYVYEESIKLSAQIAIASCNLRENQFFNTAIILSLDVMAQLMPLFVCIIPQKSIFVKKDFKYTYNIIAKPRHPIKFCVNELPIKQGLPARHSCPSPSS